MTTWTTGSAEQSKGPAYNPGNWLEVGGHMQMRHQSAAQIETAEKRSAREACTEEIITAHAGRRA